MLDRSEFSFRELLRSRFLWNGVVLYSIYWILSIFFPSRPLLESSSVLVLVGGLVVILTWFPAFLYGLASGAKIGAWQLPVGIVLTWIGLSEHRVWSLIWRFAGQPDWMQNSLFVGQANWLIFLASMLYIIAPGNETGRIPIKNWWVLATSIGVAGAAAGAVFTALVLRQ